MNGKKAMHFFPDERTQVTVTLPLSRHSNAGE